MADRLRASIRVSCRKASRRGRYRQRVVERTQLLGRGSGENILVQRFLANAEFQKLYQERLTYFRIDLFANGAAGKVLDTRVETLKGVRDIIEASTVENEASALRERFTAIAAAG